MTVSLTDTGWTNASTGGAISSGSQTDVIPTMDSDAKANHAEITASSQNINWAGTNNGSAWHAADDVGDNETRLWTDTGSGHSTVPSWLNIDFDTGASDTGRRLAITGYSIRIGPNGDHPTHAPQAWRLISANFDTGTFAIDTGKWALEDERSAQTGWAVSEKRTYTTPEGDTGTVDATRHWRLYFTTVVGGANLVIAEVEMFTAASALQFYRSGGAAILNATSIGAVAKAQKRVIVSDTGTEHSLEIEVERGPVTLRVGSTSGNDDYINETSLGTGYHNLAFVPQGNFHITLQSDAIVDRIVASMQIGDSGTVEVPTHVCADSGYLPVMPLPENHGTHG